MIPLGATFSKSEKKMWKEQEEADKRCNEIILEYLQRVGLEGWQPEGGRTTITNGGFGAGRLNFKDSGGFFNTTCTYESVTIRLQRLV